MFLLTILCSICVIDPSNAFPMFGMMDGGEKQMMKKNAPGGSTSTSADDKSDGTNCDAQIRTIGKEKEEAISERDEALKEKESVLEKLDQWMSKVGKLESELSEAKESNDALTRQVSHSTTYIAKERDQALVDKADALAQVDKLKEEIADLVSVKESKEAVDREMEQMKQDYETNVDKAVAEALQNKDQELSEVQESIANARIDLEEYKSRMDEQFATDRKAYQDEKDKEIKQLKVKNQQKLNEKEQAIERLETAKKDLRKEKSNLMTANRDWQRKHEEALKVSLALGAIVTNYKAAANHELALFYNRTSCTGKPSLRTDRT